VTNARHSPRDPPFVTIALLGIAVVAVCAACTPAPVPPMVDPTLESLIGQQAAQATLIQSQSEFLSYLATRMPPRREPPTPALIPTPFVTGVVSIEDGRCCIGATAGTTIQVTVAFEATSPLGPVTEMRVRAGARPFDEADMADAAWEPFRSKASYSFFVPLNWIGFYVTAQFRDELHNLSAVVHDDISVEGMPPLPPASATP
jgi:hypothetical protein